jgi:glutamyl-tRNA synthetase
VDADLDAVVRRFLLQNAVQYGSADAKSAMGKIMAAHPELRVRAQEVMPALLAAADAINAMEPDARRAALEAEAPELVARKKQERRTGLKPLPGVTLDADGVGRTASGSKVVMRFAPNPNGPLSLGHSRGVAVISEYQRMTRAEVVLRFDDTDAQVKPPLYDPAAGVDAYSMIAEDWAWLAGLGPDRVVRASDRLSEYYDAARELIRRGGAYVCTCDAEAFRDMKNQGHPCPHRAIAPGALAAAFEKMVKGGYERGQAVLRVKTDITHKDPALRDWTAFRIIADDAVHPREATGEIARHACWPLLDFESAVEDHLQGVTHIIRGKDLMDSTRKQKFLYDHMGWTYPETLYWGRVSVLEFGKFSTSGMRKGIEAGTYSGWDDPRLPTLAALRRRGFRAAALRRFWLGLGLTEKDIQVALENVEAENAAEIEDETPRAWFVDDPRALFVRDLAGRVAQPLVHPNHPERGRRRIEAAETIVVPAADMHHKQLRLKDLGNILLAGGSAFWTGDTLDRDIAIVQWLPKTVGRPFTVLRPDGEDLHEVKGLVEPAALAHVGATVQFERFGFVTLEDEATGIWLHA